ncbi:YkgJ family cysteine cluster protein [Wenzhouxiangella sp. EGI_FJ10305]|uniref:YkgJ family cysteine cluster protein n=1 Tax=Wenzhouxiangella sp. EGI_FJ10305 TaxID=3243768 RepID=UPI0035E01AD1
MTDSRHTAGGAIRMRVAQESLEETGRAMRQGSGRGLRQAQRVVESQTRRLPPADRGPLACEAGCDFCCHLRVMATAPEVFALLDYLRGSLHREAFARFEQRAEETDQRLRDLDSDDILRTNIPCPALVKGRCSGYAGRPLNCRSYHSTSKAACEDSFNHPEDLDRGHPQIKALAQVHEGSQAGFLSALERAGYDARQYELATALAEAMRDPEARKRMEAGERVFRVPLEIPPDG